MCLRDVSTSEMSREVGNIHHSRTNDVTVTVKYRCVSLVEGRQRATSWRLSERP